MSRVWELLDGPVTWEWGLVVLAGLGIVAGTLYLWGLAARARNRRESGREE